MHRASRPSHIPACFLYFEKKKKHIFLQNGFDAANPFMNTIITQEGRADFIFHSVSSASRRTYGAAFVPNASFGPPLGWREG